LGGRRIGTISLQRRTRFVCFTAADRQSEPVATSDKFA